MKKIILFALIAALISALALPSAAYVKNETVYASADASGNVSGVYVVNSFSSETDEKITDLGVYTSAVNLSDTSPVTLSNDGVSLTLTGGKTLYYQGNLASSKLPWTFDFKYYLDGKELSADEIAGKSGDIKIALNIKPSGDFTDFSDCFMLQITVTLSTALFTEISAVDAVSADIGGSLQLVYTVMPGTSAAYIIEAKTSSFELEPITIAGVVMSYSFDASGINIADYIDLSGFDELSEASATLGDGAKKLSDGAASLSSGAKELSDGAKSAYNGSGLLSGGIKSTLDGMIAFSSGVKELNDSGKLLSDNGKTLSDNAKALADGAKGFTDGLPTLISGASALSEGALTIEQGTADVFDGVTGISDGVGALSDSLSALSGGAKTLDNKGAELLEAAHNMLLQTVENTEKSLISAGFSVGNLAEENYAKVLSAFAENIPAAAEAVLTAKGQIDAINAFYTGICEYVGGVRAVSDGLSAASDGAKDLKTGSSALKSALPEVKTGLGGLSTGAKNLADGLSEFSGGFSSFISGLGIFASGVETYCIGASKYVAGVGEISSAINTVTAGVSELYDGASDIENGLKTLSDGAKTFSDGVAEYANGALEYSEGAATFVSETSNIGDKITEQTDGILSDVTSALGYENSNISFANAENPAVGSVQFVIRTSAVKPPETKTDTVETAPLTFWQKLIALFS